MMIEIDTVGWIVVDSTFNASGHTVISDEDRACDFRNEANANPEDYAGEAPYSVIGLCKTRQARTIIEKKDERISQLEAEIESLKANNGEVIRSEIIKMLKDNYRVNKYNGNGDGKLPLVSLADAIEIVTACIPKYQATQEKG